MQHGAKIKSYVRMESGLESSFFLTHQEALIHKLQHRVYSLRPYCCSCEPQPLPHGWGLGGRGGGGAKEQCMDSEPGCNFVEKVTALSYY